MKQLLKVLIPLILLIISIVIIIKGNQNIELFKTINQVLSTEIINFG